MPNIPRPQHRKIGCPNWKANTDAGFPCKHTEDDHWGELAERPCIHSGCRCGGGPGRIVLAHGQETLRFLRMMAEIPHVDERPVIATLAPISRPTVVPAAGIRGTRTARQRKIA